MEQDNLGNDPGTRLTNLFLNVSKAILAKSSLIFAISSILFLVVIGALLAISALFRNLAV